jgi:hypothetical protein
MSASDHGHTPAAWTGVTVCFIGFCIAGAAVILPSIPLMIVGFVVVLLGGVVGKVMQMAGMGKSHPSPPLRSQDARRAAEKSVEGRTVEGKTSEESAEGTSGRSPVNH